MSGLDFVITVLVDGGDVTQWVKYVKIDQSSTVDRKFEVAFIGWQEFNENSRFDIYGSYDPANPFQEIIIRNGTIPPDRYRTVDLSTAKVPLVVAVGYDYVWMAKRRAPRKTIILVPHRRNNEDNVKKAIENHGKPIGRYQVWPGMNRLSTAVRRLAWAGGLNVRVTIPDYDIQPKVIDPSLSYWHAIKDLAKPFAPHIYYVRQNNTLVLADRMTEVMNTSNSLTLSADSVKAITAVPSVNSRIRRVILRIPEWR